MKYRLPPSTLVDVVSTAGHCDAQAFGLTCNEFCDAFYEDYPDREAMQAHLDPEPEATGDPQKDAWIGAIGEHLALRWGLEVPRWTRRPIHFALMKPVFMPQSLALRTALIAESPSAFRSRLIYTMAEPLRRAKFPSGVRPTHMPWVNDAIN